MNYELTKAADLTAEDWQCWSELASSHAHLDSPFFRPEFAQCVNSARGDVEVIRLVDSSEPVGFFPFQRSKRGNVAQSVAGRLSEFHGLICPADLPVDPVKMLRQCGIASWAFDHLPANQKIFDDYHWGKSDSLYMDLSGGYDEYVKALRARKSGSLSQTLRKGRKVERELGELQFTMHSTDDDAMKSLRQWKTQQHERTGVLQVFDYEWVLSMLDEIRQVQTSEFAGVFSTLSIGGELAAVHLGMRTSSALHIWFPAYNRKFEKYSPGLILLLRLAERCAADGVRKIDFGRGVERYKHEFQTGQTPLLEGAVELRPATRLAKQCWHGFKTWARTSPYGAHLARPLNATRRLRQYLAFRH